MKTLKAQVEECVERIVVYRNKAERERYRKAINYARERLIIEVRNAATQCDNLLAKISDIEYAKERENNVTEYRKAVRTRNAFQAALEIVSDTPAFSPPVQESEKYDSDIYGEVGVLVCRVADAVRADEKAKARRRSIVKRARIRAAAKKSIKRK